MVLSLPFYEFRPTQHTQSHVLSLAAAFEYGCASYCPISRNPLGFSPDISLLLPSLVHIPEIMKLYGMFVVLQNTLSMYKQEPSEDVFWNGDQRYMHFMRNVDLLRRWDTTTV